MARLRTLRLWILKHVFGITFVERYEPPFMPKFKRTPQQEQELEIMHSRGEL